MDNNKIREPQQKRSLEKKRRIIEAGYNLFIEKGYYNTTTAEIAREAGVSTGIVYSYFKDKKAIYIEALGYITKTISAPIYDMVKEMTSADEMIDNLDIVFDAEIEFHKKYQLMYQESVALKALDPEIDEAYSEFNKWILNEVLTWMKAVGENEEHLVEKLYIILGIIESYVHEYSYSRKESLDYDIMRKYYIGMIKNVYNQD